MAKKWIAGAIRKPGALHKALGVKKGRKIPAKKKALKKGDTLLMRRRKILARTLGRFSKRKRRAAS